MLTPSGAVRYLIDHSLMHAAAAVDGSLRILDVSRRHQSFAVLSERGPSYIVKQALDAQRAITLAHEASVYRLLHQSSARTDVEDYVPRVVSYDAVTQVLVLEFVSGALNLRELHLKTGRVPVRLARFLGTALGALHSSTVAPGAGSITSTADRQTPPWILSVHRPDFRTLSELSAASLQLIQIVARSDDMCEAIQSLHDEWQATTLTHNDMKWDNCLVVGRPTRLKIVDWELAGPGDPLWDAATVVGEYLSCWVLSVSMLGPDGLERAHDTARNPLTQIQAALRAFWSAYCQRTRLPVDHDEAILLITRYAAVRLIQTALEQGQGTVQPAAAGIYLLQLSANLLQRPLEGAVHLIGLPVETSSAA